MAALVRAFAEVCIAPVLLVTGSIARSASLPVFNLLRGRLRLTPKNIIVQTSGSNP